ncbi:MAG: hypothetical protein PHI63_04630 [Patescibacteria group bacterium]|nr:hypothetical protein [Patescibacteria group bacterium]
MSTQITVLDLEAYGGCMLEQLGEQALGNITANRTTAVSQRWLRKTFELPAGVPLEPALRQAVADRIVRYRATLPEKKRAFGAQADDCVRIAAERNYVGNPAGFTIVVTDDLLHRGLPGHLRCWAPPHHVCAYSLEHNAVFVAHTLPNLIVAHETGHALSLQRNRYRIGFLQLEPKANGGFRRCGSKWLDEGITVLWEELTVNDGSTIPERQNPDDWYCWARNATQILVKELGVDQETALRAYFGNLDAYHQLTRQVSRWYGCALDDLQHVALYTDIGFTRRLLQSEPVEHRIGSTIARIKRSGVWIAQGKDTRLTDSWHKLAATFPNLTLID